MSDGNFPVPAGSGGMMMFAFAGLTLLLLGVVIGYIVIQGRSGSKTVTFLRNPQTGAIESIVQ